MTDNERVIITGIIDAFIGVLDMMLTIHKPAYLRILESVLRETKKEMTIDYTLNYKASESEDDF